MNYKSFFISMAVFLGLAAIAQNDLPISMKSLCCLGSAIFAGFFVKDLT